LALQCAAERWPPGTDGQQQSQFENAAEEVPMPVRAQRPNSSSPLANAGEPDQGCPREALGDGDLLPLLNELCHAVSRLAETGEGTRIDLSAMPFGPDDEARLLEHLGRGEVSAHIDALGPTCIHETRFPGIWVVDYGDTDGKRAALHLEVDLIPRILRTQPADLVDTVTELNTLIQQTTNDAIAAELETEAGTAVAPESGAPAGPDRGD
jgi:hydrogenase-1 operon protein HyaF